MSCLPGIQDTLIESYHEVNSVTRKSLNIASEFWISLRSFSMWSESFSSPNSPMRVMSFWNLFSSEPKFLALFSEAIYRYNGEIMGFNWSSLVLFFVGCHFSHFVFAFVD